jgi:hypothetical protein
MQRTWIIALDILLFLLLVSCMSVREEIVFHRDLSGSYVIEEAFDKKAIAENYKGSDWEDQIRESRANTPKGFRFERKTSKDKDTIRYTCTFHGLRDLERKSAGLKKDDQSLSDLRWTRTRWTLRCQGRTPAIETEIVDSYTLKITMPGRIRKCNADKIAGRTATWEKSEKKILVESWIPPSPWAIAAAGGAVVIVTAGLIGLCRRRRRLLRKQAPE